MSLFLSIEPFQKDEISHCKVRIDVDYNKDKKGPVATMQTIGLTNDGCETFSIFGSPRTRVVLEQGWKSNNKKRVEAASDMVRTQLAGQCGDLWDALCKMLADVGSKVIIESETPAKPSEIAPELLVPATVA